MTWLAVVMVAGAMPLPAAAQRPVDFNRDIRPILSDKCYRCHGPDATHREADLRLDTQKGALADLDGRRAIVPGDAVSSVLVQRITHADVDERMPPADSGKTLSDDQIALLTRWIDEGARWSQAWAYVPPARHPTPHVRDMSWPVGWIDALVLARLEAEGLAPSPEADRVTLIRRLSFDLTGLPPTPDEVTAFVADRDPLAYERLVDRLLASPHYGERMAIYWLDLVRYADTVGYHGDQDHNISPYRDWVIDAFNENMPLDQFAREQLAGDLLPDATIDHRIATGYNRLLQTSHEGGVQPKEYLAIYAADRVRNFSAVWMGATMGCCQCHDHKYDPYTTKDFYSLVAFFADVDEAQHFKVGNDAIPTRRPPEISVLSKSERARVRWLDAQIDGLGQQLAAVQASAEDAAAEQADDASKTSDADVLKKQLDAAIAERDAIQKAARPTMITVAIEPREIRILPRGNWLDDSGPVVEPAVPAFLGKLDTGGRRATRLDLANWLTNPQHGCGGLTARVFANRLWYLTFGVGIAKVLDDFGGQGEPPVHPELLDRLALELVDSGWDVKHVLRLLVTSRAYRQSSLASPELARRDPDNRLVARQSRYRLPAEMVRDTALAISGLLVRDIGGPSVRPYQPVGYYRHLNFPARKYVHDTDARQWRRGVYVHWQRQYLHPMLKALDAPSREECTAQRPVSNTPLAALALLNDPTFVESARVFAARILHEGGDSTESRLAFAYRQAVSRPPDENEAKLLAGLLDSSRAVYQDDTAAAGALLATGLARQAKGFDAAELAAWTAVARAILNLSETVTRN